MYHKKYKIKLNAIFLSVDMFDGWITQNKPRRDFHCGPFLPL